MESFRRISLTVVVFVLAGSASLNAQGVTTSKAKYTAGEPITVNFSDGPGNPTDWIGLYRPDTAPMPAWPGGEWNSVVVTDPQEIRGS